MTFMCVSLANRVALVTGGSRGIGKGISMALAKAGAKVFLTYKSRQEMALQTCAEIGAAGGFAAPMHLRVEDRASVEEVVTKITSELGKIDILVNNAAVSHEQPFDTITDEDFEEIMTINLGGPFRCCQAVLPGMLDRRWGRIINISSIGGQWGGFNQVHYAASKAGLINFTRSIAKIYSDRGITSNAIAPGLVATEMSSAELNTDAGKEKVRNIPAKRLGTSAEVGAAVVYLAAEESGYVTGQTINLNGGMYFG